MSFHLFLDNLFVCWKSATALKERGIAVTGTVRKNAVDYPPRLLQLKAANRALVWGELQASIVKGVCYWLWQDSNAVIGILYFYLFFHSLNFAYFSLQKMFSFCLNFFAFLHIFSVYLKHYSPS
jgi:hypothetical protein